MTLHAILGTVLGFFFKEVRQTQLKQKTLCPPLCGLLCLGFLGDVHPIWQANIDTCQKESAFLLYIIPKT